jgi:hypothetical protein
LGSLRGRGRRLRRGGGLRFKQNTANQVRDVIGHDAQLILRFENAAQTLVKERN